MQRMMVKLAQSPVAPEIRAATIRIATSGSVSRARMRAGMRRAAGAPVLLRPY